MLYIINIIKEWVKPKDGWQFKTPEEFTKQRQFQALFIGIFAFILPIWLFIGGLVSSCSRDTISHYYYAPVLGDLFIVITCAVGLLLLLYRGQSPVERSLAVVAGAAAICAALVPTTGSGCEGVHLPSRVFLYSIPLESYDPLTPLFQTKHSWSANVHGISAAIMFVILAIFSMFVFTATDPSDEHQSAKGNTNKVYRNKIYKCSGIIIFVSIVAIGLNKLFHFELNPTPNTSIWDSWNLTFAFESFALLAFGFAWIVKGRGGGFLFRDDTPSEIINVRDGIKDIKMYFNTIR